MAMNDIEKQEEEFFCDAMKRKMVFKRKSLMTFNNIDAADVTEKAEFHIESEMKVKETKIVDHGERKQRERRKRQGNDGFTVL